MKTPREILLEQNHHHDSRLESLQRDVITNSFENRAKRMECARLAAAFVRLTQTVCSDLILPARRIWLGYAFIWIAIIAFHLATADRTPTQIGKTSNPSEAIANWKAQQTILAELTKQPEHEPADRPKPRAIPPRSESRHPAIG